MTEEEKAAQEAQANEQSNAADAEATKDDESKDEGEAKDTESQIDYEAELKKERDARINAERALAEKRFKAAEAKRKQEEDDGDDQDDDDQSQPLTARQLEAILAKEREQTQKQLQQQQAEEIAKSMSTSEAEAKLVVEIFQNRSFPSHLTLTEKVEEAFAIANRKKLIGERNEALRALKARSGINNNPATDHKESAPGSEPNLPPQDAQAIKAAGFAWNGMTRRYEKKLSNGSTLARDPKTKQTFLVKR